MTSQEALFPKRDSFKSASFTGNGELYKSCSNCCALQWTKFQRDREKCPSFGFKKDKWTVMGNLPENRFQGDPQCEALPPNDTDTVVRCIVFEQSDALNLLYQPSLKYPSRALKNPVYQEYLWDPSFVRTHFVLFDVLSLSSANTAKRNWNISFLSDHSNPKVWLMNKHCAVR